MSNPAGMRSEDTKPSGRLGMGWLASGYLKASGWIAVIGCLAWLVLR